MALLRLDLVQPHEERTRIVRILNYKRNEEGDYTVYTIHVKVGEYSWTVERRYREFLEFDRERFANYSKKSFMPPKKLVGNSEPAFLEQRRSELEQYLRTVLELELWLQKKSQRGGTSIPRGLSRFLDFHKYEVHGIVECLAEILAKNGNGETWLEQSSTKPKYFLLNPIELHGLKLRLTLPEPTSSTGQPNSDVGHILDFLARVPHLKIKGAKGNIGTSDIECNKLSCCLNPCKALKSLWLIDVEPGMIQGLANVKLSLKSLVVHYSLDKLSDLLRDRESESLSLPTDDVSSMQPWAEVVDADFSFNQLVEIDETIRLLPKLTRLDLTGNRLVDIGFHLQHLPFLTDLTLSNNGLEKLELWHARLGNVKRLILTGNSIRSLHGLSKMYSLEYLDVSDNAIMTTPDVWPVGKLPCLEVLILRGNPIESAVEYRTRVLEAFGERAAEAILDDKKGSQRELDTVGVRLAIRKAREEKELMLEKTRQQISEKLRFLSEETLGDISGSSGAFPPTDGNGNLGQQSES